MLQAIALWKKAIALQPDDSTYERAIYRDALAVQDYKTAYQAVQAGAGAGADRTRQEAADDPAQAAEAADRHHHRERQHRHALTFSVANTLQRVWQTVSSACRRCGTMVTMTPSILIVDDHPSFRAMARALLQSEGYTIVGEAVDGASALTAARELHPEVVLLDVQLPDTDGFAVAGRADPRHAIAPAIVLTSSRDASDFGPLIAESGARGFVPKGELCGARSPKPWNDLAPRCGSRRWSPAWC